MLYATREKALQVEGCWGNWETTLTAYCLPLQIRIGLSQIQWCVMFWNHSQYGIPAWYYGMYHGCQRAVSRSSSEHPLVASQNLCFCLFSGLNLMLNLKFSIQPIIASLKLLYYTGYFFILILKLILHGQCILADEGHHVLISFLFTNQAVTQWRKDRGKLATFFNQRRSKNASMIYLLYSDLNTLHFSFLLLPSSMNLIIVSFLTQMMTPE